MAAACAKLRFTCGQRPVVAAIAASSRCRGGTYSSFNIYRKALVLSLCEWALVASKGTLMSEERAPHRVQGFQVEARHLTGGKH